MGNCVFSLFTNPFTSCELSSIDGASALGASAHGASALGASALGASALGASAHGASALGASALGASALGASALGVPAKNKTKHGILIIELYLVTYFFNLNEPVIINNYKMFNDILNAISSCKELLYNRCIQRLILNLRIKVKDSCETALMRCIRSKKRLFGLSKIILSFKDISKEYLLYYGKAKASALVLSYSNHCQYLFDSINIFELDISFLGPDGSCTLLHALVDKNKYDELNKLLHRIYRKRWINFRDHNNTHTPLHLACELNHLECIKVLLSFKETKINTKLKNLLDRNWVLHETPLLTACSNNNTEVAKLLLARPSIDINIYDYFSRNALLFACRNNNTELIILLLKYKSCKLAEYSFESNPLLFVLRYNNKEAMNAILHHPKIKKYINIGTNPIIYILSEHSGKLKYKLIKYLFSYSFIDVNNTMSQIHPVNTALIECIKTIQTDPINHKIINILLSKPNISISYINYVNREGNSALKLACRHGLYDVVKRLLEFDDIDVSYIKTYDRTSALSEAIKGGHTEIVKLLKDYLRKT